MTTDNKKFYGWKVLVALWTVYFLNMGFSLYGGTVISSNMLADIQMSRSLYGMGFSLQNLFIAVPSMLIAASIMKRGVVKTYITGSMMILVGALWMILVASQPWHFLLGIGVIMGTGIGFGTVIPTTTTVSRWFNRYRGRAMAFTMTAPGIAGLIISPFMQRIISQSGGNWRLGWIVCAVAMILSIGIAILFIKDSPESIGQIPDGSLPKADTAQSGKVRKVLSTTYEWTANEAYKTRAFWIILLGACATQFPFFFFVAHWILFMMGSGFDITTAAFTMGLFTVTGLIGRIIAGWLMDTIEARFTFLMGLALYLVASVLSINMIAGNLIMAYAATTCFGIAFGWSFVCMQTITANYYGRKAYPKLNGMIILISGVLCAPAALIAGKLFEISKNYNGTFSLIIGIVVLGIAALAFAKMPVANHENA